MEWILNHYLITIFIHTLPDNTVVNMSQQPTLDYNLQKLITHHHQVLEINIYTDNTEYDGQVYEKL